jgi:hypothetical protein
MHGGPSFDKADDSRTSRAVVRINPEADAPMLTCRAAYFNAHRPLTPTAPDDVQRGLARVGRAAAGGERVEAVIATAIRRSASFDGDRTRAATGLCLQL